MWNDNRYAPNKKPKTGPNAAMLYMKPDREGGKHEVIYEYIMWIILTIKIITDIHRRTFILYVIINICCS